MWGCESHVVAPYIEKKLSGSDSCDFELTPTRRVVVVRGTISRSFLYSLVKLVPQYFIRRPCFNFFSVTFFVTMNNFNRLQILHDYRVPVYVGSSMTRKACTLVVLFRCFQRKMLRRYVVICSCVTSGPLLDFYVDPWYKRQYVYV